MRAVVIHEFGAEDVLRLEDVAEPRAGAGEVVVKVGSVEVSRTRDIAVRTGKHPFSKFVALPHVLGGDFAGEVVEAGAGVDPSLVGRRFAVSNTQTCSECEACRGGHQEQCPHLTLLGIHREGSYAEYAVVKTEVLHPIPADLSFSEAAAMAADGPIAFTQLEVAGAGEDTPLLVTGVTGALGSTLVALADRLGARVLGISRRPAEIPPALPLAARLDAGDPELTAALGEASGGAGIAAAIDNVANPGVFEQYFPALGIGAKIVISGAIGTPELPVLPVPAAPLYTKSISLLGVRTTTPADRRRFWELVDAGFRLPAGSVQELPLEQAAQAHAQITAGTHLGHTVLTVGA
jgi:L-gulonate 5-dehydrogenase